MEIGEYLRPKKPVKEENKVHEKNIIQVPEKLNYSNYSGTENKVYKQDFRKEESPRRDIWMNILFIVLVAFLIYGIAYFLYLAEQGKFQSVVNQTASPTILTNLTSNTPVRVDVNQPITNNNNATIQLQVILPENICKYYVNKTGNSS